MILKVVLISIVLVCVCFLGFAIKILIKRNGKFPQIHIGKNKEMAKRGIHCANTTDYLERQNYKPINID